ncbi:MAG: hypothetical protein HYY17_03220 [Planctomycetes bacterium]|nr:hypothetical protein [Planctomycetota bacterium]
MSFKPPSGWQTETDKLFVHNSGVRLQLTTYRGEEGWFLVPVDLDQAVIKFDPTPEGRDKGFAAFESGTLAIKPKKAAAPEKPKGGRRKPIAVPEEEPAEEAEGHAEGEKVEEKDEEDGEDEDEDEEKEEKEEKGGEEG